MLMVAGFTIGQKVSSKLNPRLLRKTTEHPSCFISFE